MKNKSSTALSKSYVLNLSVTLQAAGWINYRELNNVIDQSLSSAEPSLTDSDCISSHLVNFINMWHSKQLCHSFSTRPCDIYHYVFLMLPVTVSESAWHIVHMSVMWTPTWEWVLVLHCKKTTVKVELRETKVKMRLWAGCQKMWHGEMKRKDKVDLILTRAKEFLGLSALHGPLLLKLQHRRSEDPLDLLRHIPPGLVVLGLGYAAWLHLRSTGQAEDSVTLQFGWTTVVVVRGNVFPVQKQ